MKLFYRKYGEGPPLVILHGLYGSSDNWATIAKNLSNTFTVYVPDMRNHGKSPHSAIHDYDSMRDDIYELCMDLNLKKIFLAGHSMGGKAAIAFALRWPEMLNGLLIADISPFINENTKHFALNQHIEILNAITSTDISGVTSRSDVEVLISKKIRSEKIRGFILKNINRISGNGFEWKIDAVSLLNNLPNIMDGAAGNASTAESVSGFPVIFLKGSDSDYLTEDDYPGISMIFPAAEFITVSGAGHWIHADRPDEVVKYLKKLL